MELRLHFWGLGDVSSKGLGLLVDGLVFLSIPALVLGALQSPGITGMIRQI